jgi:antitoxin component YwqK of YwqJK toxin-antitoxin module
MKPMKKILFVTAVFIINFSCKHDTAVKRTTLDQHWIDSIIRASDTSWEKPYRNNEYVKAYYYADTHDSIITQLMKDSAGHTRQVNVAKYDMVRLFYGEYYPNGQIKANRPLDSLGRFDGVSQFFYEDGHVRSEGKYAHGFFAGEWKSYDPKGNLISTDTYDENGTLISSKKN